MDNKITVDTLNDFKPMNNNVIIRNITDSIEDSERNEKLGSNILIVRNESNQKREKSVGEVVSTSPELFFGNGNTKCIVNISNVLNKTVIYDTHSRLADITIKEFPDEKFYLVRFPDVIAVIEEE